MMLIFLKTGTASRMQDILHDTVENTLECYKKVKTEL